jgi:hypothetical protein
MRFSDIGVVAAILPALGSTLLQRPAPAWSRALIGVAALVVVYQLLTNNHRWHMAPAYFVIGTLLSEIWPGWFQPGVYSGWAAVACLLLALLLCSLLPAFDFPPVTGAFPVGTVQLRLTDPSRAETFPSDPPVQRELMIQIWYPAASVSGRRAQYLSRSATALKTSHLALVHMHSVASAPFASRCPDRGFPVLLFLPSWVGGKAQNTFQTEELTSHGFVVVGMDHPYGTKLTVFDDGRMVRSTLGDFLDVSSDETLAGTREIAEKELRIRTLDVRFVIDELTRLNNHDPTGLVTGKLDLTRIGIFGHSFGGAVAAQSCFIDPRLQAGINMDGILLGEVTDKGVRQPFLFMSDDTPPPTAIDLESPSPRRRCRSRLIQRDLFHIEQSLAAHGGYYMAIEGAHHMNFSDAPLFCPVKRLTGAGPVKVRRAMRIINAYTLAFFRHHLTGTPEPLLETEPAPFVEVRFRRLSAKS